MRPAPGEVLHFSDDPAIDVFAPHRAATAQPEPVVCVAGRRRAGPGVLVPSAVSACDGVSRPVEPAR